MIPRAAVSPQLVEELRMLHVRQREAVLHEGSVVVLAGPGSGKTRTLVARASYVLSTRVSPFRGAACITYTNSAATEMKRRMRNLGTSIDRRFVCGTLHSFCLRQILRLDATAKGGWTTPGGTVLGDADQIALLQECFDHIGITELAKYRVPTATTIRRALACGEDVSRFDEREVAAAIRFDQLLEDRQQIDYEAMTTRALRLVRDHWHVQDLLRSRFPHLIVDEFQDLGGVLFELVLALRDGAGIEIFAVGDPDQSIFGFTGADPRYLRELAARPDFRTIDLEVNYRSGQRIIRASEAALGELRGRQATSGSDPGEVQVISVEGGFDEHAAEAADEVEQRMADGVPPERVAILYPRKGPLLDRILNELDARQVAYQFERNDRLPPGSLTRFIVGCASRAVLMSSLRKASPKDVPSLRQRSEAPDVQELDDALQRLRREAAATEGSMRLDSLRELQRALDPPIPIDETGPANEWLASLATSLGLVAMASVHPERDNTRCLELLLETCTSRAMSIQDLASGVEILGKVVLTTYHSSKGREFDTVVLPGLVAGYFPPDVKADGRWRPPDDAEIAEFRRQFYVALSRAESRACLIVGSAYETPNGYTIRKGPSPLAVEVARAIHLM